MSSSNSSGLLAAVVIGTVVIGAAQGGGTDEPVFEDTPASTVELPESAFEPVDVPAPQRGAGDVVTGTHMSRSGSVERHYAMCGTAADAEAAYEVELPADDPDMEYRLVEGEPCPSGPGIGEPELTAADKYPELYDAMNDEIHGGGQ